VAHISDSRSLEHDTALLWRAIANVHRGRFSKGLENLEKPLALVPRKIAGTSSSGTTDAPCIGPSFRARSRSDLASLICQRSTRRHRARNPRLRLPRHQLDEADDLNRLLGLSPGRRLLDIGAGAGWPGLYMAKSSGCDVTLIDPDAERIALACARAVEDNLEGDWAADVGDGASLPYEDATFDAIGHSDALCCMSDKHGVLTECCRVAKSDAHMAFSVIAAESGLGDTAYRRALDHGPDLMATEDDYPTKLRTTGWYIVRHDDMTQAFLIATQRQLQSGDGREEKWKGRIAALNDGLLRRDLFVVAPADQ